MKEASVAEKSDRERELSAAVEDALRTCPMAPAPPTLLPGAMARILRQAERPRFKVGWLEWALGLFAVLMVGVTLWVVSLWLPGDWPLWVQSEGTVLWQTLDAYRVWVAAAGGAVVLLATMVAAAALALCEPQYSTTHRVAPTLGGGCR
jgi:hypothetical protein